MDLRMLVWIHWSNSIFTVWILLSRGNTFVTVAYFPFAMGLVWLHDHLLILAAPEVKLVLLIRRGRIIWSDGNHLWHRMIVVIHLVIQCLALWLVWSAWFIAIMRVLATSESWRVVRLTIACRVIPNRIAWMFVVERNLSSMRHRVMHHTSMTVRYTWIALMRHTIRSMRIAIWAWHHWIRVTRVSMIVLPVRTLIIHISVFALIGFTLTNCWRALGPMTSIRSVFCSHSSSYLVRSAVRLIHLTLVGFLVASRIQIWGLIFTIFLLLVVLILARAFILCDFRLSGWLYIPGPMIRIHHRRLISVVRIEFTLPDSLHVITELTSNRWRPPIMSSIIDIGPLIVMMLLLNVFCRHHVCGRLLSLYNSWRKLTSRRGRRLCSTSWVLRSVWCVRWFGFLELIALASVVLGDFSAFVRVHYLELDFVLVKDFNNGVMRKLVWRRTICQSNLNL